MALDSLAMVDHHHPRYPRSVTLRADRDIGDVNCSGGLQCRKRDLMLRISSAFASFAATLSSLTHGSNNSQYD